MKANETQDQTDQLSATSYGFSIGVLLKKEVALCNKKQLNSFIIEKNLSQRKNRICLYKTELALISIIATVIVG